MLPAERPYQNVVIKHGIITNVLASFSVRAQRGDKKLPPPNALLDRAHSQSPNQSQVIGARKPFFKEAFWGTVRLHDIRDLPAPKRISPGLHIEDKEPYFVGEKNQGKSQNTQRFSILVSAYPRPVKGPGGPRRVEGLV